MSEKKTILHIITGLEDGGAEAVLYRVIRSDDHYTHVVISLRGEGKYAALLHQCNVPVYILNLNGVLCTIKSLSRIRRIISTTSPLLIHTWLYHADFLGGLIGRISRCPVIWGVHHSDTRFVGVSLSCYVITRMNALLSYIVPSDIIFCSKVSYENHARIGYHKEKKTIIHNGVDTAVFSPNLEQGRIIREQLGVSDDTFLVGMVARYNPVKGHRFLLDSIALASERVDHDIMCLLVGSGINDQNEKLMSDIASAGVSDAILLLESRNDIPAIMNALDTHVLASSGEAFGNVTCEAMACGVRCITTDVGVGKQILGNTGWLVKFGDSKGLADAIVNAARTCRYDYVCNDCVYHVRENFSQGMMRQRYHNTWSRFAKWGEHGKGRGN